MTPQMTGQKTRGMRRIINAFVYSYQGFRQCYAQEAAFRQEVIATVLIVPLALWLGASGVEKALLLGSWLMVLVVELLNSAIEAVVDRTGTEHHPLSGQAKDIASAAVLSSVTVAALVWLLILLPRWT